MRFVRLANEWSFLFVRLIISLDEECKQEQINQIDTSVDDKIDKWNKFDKYSTRYLELIEKIPNGPVILKKYQYHYIHTILCKNNTGLGP
jgi:hypothetical protein